MHHSRSLYPLTRQGKGGGYAMLYALGSMLFKVRRSSKFLLSMRLSIRFIKPESTFPALFPKPVQSLFRSLPHGLFPTTGLDT